MGFRSIKVGADKLAKLAMVYLPLLWVVMVVSIVCFAAKPGYIAPSLFIATLTCAGLLVLCLLPSWTLDVIASLRPPRTKSEAAIRLARREGLPIIDIKMVDYDLTDLKGLPE